MYAELGSGKFVQAWENDISKGVRSLCWISGLGGSGKSTLAFEMARRAAFNKGRQVRLIVLVEEDWKPSSTTDSALVSWLAEFLQIRGRQFSVQMIRLLLRSGHIVLLLDGFSERQVSGATEQIAALIRQELVRYLLVTSRDHCALSNVNTIEINPLEDSILPIFVDKYVDGGFILPEDKDNLLSAIRNITVAKPTRALFVRLAIEQYKKNKSLPGSYAELIQQYVLQTRPGGPGALEEESVLRAARLAAYACLSQDFRPRWVTREFMLGSLSSAGTVFLAAKDPSTDSSAKAISPSEVLDQLVRCGLLQQDVRVSYLHVGFWEDTIADYLAAMYIHMAGNTTAPTTPKRPDQMTRLGLEEALREIESR
jgi:hypothetical protein